jgi:N-hydroxyarylamine O-acetyltransferase
MLDLDAYLERIDYVGPRVPTLETLRAVHGLHPLAIAFENLDPLLGRPVRLDPESLQRKLLEQRRGGYCFEQNTLFAQVLTALGFRVFALSARVIWTQPDDGTRARTHMLLFVQLGEGAYLCDVGFGGLTLTAPLRLEPDVEQSTPHEVFRVVRDGREFLLQVRLRGQWKAMYRFDLQEQRSVDIEVLNFYVSTHPESQFLRRLMAARPVADRRFVLRNGTFGTYYMTGQEEQRELTSVAELRSVLASVFGIDVPAGSAADVALARVLA